MKTWVDAGGEAFEKRGSETNLRPAYPPSTLPVLAPLALLDWTAARDLFLACVVGLFPALLWAVLRLGNLRPKTNAGLLTCSFALALAPWHAAVAWQSISAPAIELAIIAVALQSDVGSGTTTGLALCLKPQLAMWFVLFQAVEKRWKRVFIALGVFAFVTLVAIARMPAGWSNFYRENLRYFFALGDVNDFTLRNRLRFELLNLQVIFYYLTRGYRVASVLSLVSTAILVICWFRKTFRSAMLSLAVIVLIGLLPAYQRIYNAGVIILVLPYALRVWSEVRGKVLLALCCVFLVPGVAILQIAHMRGWIDDAVWAHNWAFNLFIGPHATWAVLGIIAILLFWPDP